jgi:hypothetical protein
MLASEARSLVMMPSQISTSGLSGYFAATASASSPSAFIFAVCSSPSGTPNLIASHVDCRR